MSKMATALFVLAPAVFMAGCDIEDLNMDGTRYKEDFHGNFILKSGGRLEVENFNGSVEITGWDKDSVEVNATKYAPTEELLRNLKIDVASTADSIRIRSVRPLERRGNMGVKYIIMAPRRVVLDRIVSSNGSIRLNQLEGNATLKTSNGSIRANGLKGDVEAHTSNGAVELQDFRGSAVVQTSNGSVKADGLRGRVSASTSNGTIDVTVADPEPGQSIKLNTSNGRVNLAMAAWKNNDIIVSTNNSSITVRLPDKPNARVKASTSNGSIQSDFDVSIQGAMNKHHLDGVMGSGGALLDLTSSNGAIRITRYSPGS